MNIFEAELVGMHLGDGTLYRNKTSTVWELRGGLDEQEFYDTRVVRLVQEVFGERVIAKKRSGGNKGCYGVRICGKRIEQFFGRYGIKSGNKTRIARIPEQIEKDKEIMLACLRGLFATDGTAYLARINHQTKPTYPIIEFCTSSEVLREQVKKLLEDQGFAPRSWTYFKQYRSKGPVYYVRLAGKAKTKRFQEIVGLINPKQVRRLQQNNNV